MRRINSAVIVFASTLVVMAGFGSVAPLAQVSPPSKEAVQPPGEERGSSVVAPTEEQQPPSGGVQERAVPGMVEPPVGEAPIVRPPHTVAPPGMVVPPAGNAPPPAGVGPRTFHVVSYGGKCLDFGPPPQVSGAPVFIYGCNSTIAQQVVVQEINDRHEVILRAGTKVIGVKGSTKPTASSGGTAPMGNIPAAPPQPEVPLELQDETLTPRTPLALGQIFALDGDSIILGTDRTRVVKVLNNRGANRTPLVLGPRELADNEFWTFVATDKSDRKPTNGFVRVPQEKDFVKAVLDVSPKDDPSVPPVISWGTVIEVDPSALIDLSNVYLNIPEGVTIRSNRRGTNFGAELWTSNPPNVTMLEIGGHDVRITGLRLRGPSRKTDKGQPGARGIVAHDNFVRSIIDHNDMSDWTFEAIRVEGGDDTLQCPWDSNPKGSRPQNVRVSRNFIHHDRMQGEGYGVASYSAFPLIEGNTFVSNRHAIAAGARGCTNYLAWYNLVLSDAPKQDRWGPFNDYTHDFDVHGTGTLKYSVEPFGTVEVRGFGGYAGQYFEIARNTFLGTNRENFDLRGKPSYLAEFHHNVSRRDQEEGETKGDAVECSYCGAGIDRLSVYNNQFNAPNPTDRLGVGDFDGDGTDDLFLATGAAWYYAPAGKAEWRFLNAQTDGIGSLLFGDFDGDGRTDVFTLRGPDWLVSWAGASPWEKINYRPVPMSELAIGDFDGDGRADVFYADGQRWWVSYGGVLPIRHTQDSGYRVRDLGFGDFNGDGKTDVVGAVSGRWMVSLSATGAWEDYRLRPALTNTMAGLKIADLNGDGLADIVTSSGSQVSWAGTSDWRPLRNVFGVAAIGRFDDTPGADLLFWESAVFPLLKNIYILSSGSSTPKRQSRQDMR